MTKFKTLLASGLVGLLSFSAGCDDNMDIEVSRLKVDETEFRFIQNERIGYDSSTIGIYDAEGKLRGEFKGDYFPEGYLIDNDGDKYRIYYSGPSEEESIPYVKEVPVSEKDNEKTLE